MSSFVLHCLRSGDTVLSHSLLSEIAPSEDPVAGRHGAASLGATVSWLESAHADSSLTGLLGMTAPGKVPNKDVLQARTHQVGWTGWPASHKNPHSATFPALDDKHMLPHQAFRFVCGSGAGTQVVLLAEQVLYQLSDCISGSPG
ncbi:hypothetical protein ACRRTK_008800 [Alexandromys fortis]